ncbi:trypsin-like peptidase domain-containing protein [Candidatus Woesearchaeota archaeon]|nr:trypsin-like peptidase domain-containing protein [Candidatus Woesearchaeota archaeon]
MKREWKIHLIYGAVLLIVVLGLLVYQNNQEKTMRTEFTDRFDSLSQQLEQQRHNLSAQIASLGQEVDVKTTQLDKSIQERGQEIAGLSGKLDEVETQSKEEVAKLQDSLSRLKLENQDFSQVIDDSIPSVVSISTNTGSGSGFIIDDNGNIVTNYHVIEGATAAVVETSDGRRHRVKVVGFNQRADVAVLQINATGLDPIRFGDSDSLRVGEKVIAVGNPGGFDFSVSQGIVSNTQRVDGSGRELVQIDVPINPGNSGGPLINAAGQVVGVNTLKIKDFEGIGFALSSNYVERIVEDILRS